LGALLPQRPLLSGKRKLDIIAVFLLALLGATAWHLTHPFNLWSILPLLLIGYAGFRIAFELTFNRANIPTIATSFVGRRKIARLLHHEAETKQPYAIIDLGSGRGELTRVIAKSIPNARVTGIEIAHFPHLQAKFIQRWLGPSNLTYECLDFWTFDCSEIDAVVFFLTPNFAERVGEKLYRELKTGSIVISHTFPLRGHWVPLKIVNYYTPFKETIYLYKKA
jgi:SAM-dependent methyltransferase